MEVRVDKYLFTMRLYKTRSIATDACRCGRVKMNGVELKPSRCFHVGDIFTLRRGPITCTYRILQLSENRLGAKLVPNYLQDITTPDQLELLQLARLASQSGRDRGTGRPTKKDRREIISFMSDNADYDDELDTLEDLGFTNEELGFTDEEGSFTDDLGFTNEDGSFTDDLGFTHEDGSFTDDLGFTHEE